MWQLKDGAGSGSLTLMDSILHLPTASGSVPVFDHPEVVVAGLPEERSKGILGSVQAMFAEGIMSGDGDASGDIIEGFDVPFRLIPQDLLISSLVQAPVFYGDRPFAALQLMWPDRDGNFPGEKYAPSWLSDRQALSP